MKNSLQAVLERQVATTEPEIKVAEPKPQSKSVVKAVVEPKVDKFYRPSRDGRRFLGGHFDPDVARQMKMLAAEEDTTTQALLEEAIDMLFVKKGRGRIIGI